MWKKTVSVGFSLLLLTLLSLFPGATQAQEETQDQPATQPNFILVNYIGQELHLDLNDVQYTVPGTATAPDGGRLELTLPVGTHKFAANVAGVPLGHAGEFTLSGGETVAKAATIELRGPSVGPDGILLAKPKEKVKLVDFDPFAPVAEEPLPMVDAWQPAPAASGMGSVVFINHHGADELTIDWEGQLYKVPPKLNDIPGRLQIQVAPGLYRYTASVPEGSLSGEQTMQVGQVLGLSFSVFRPAPEYDVGDFYDPLQPAEITVFQENLTDQAAATPAAAPAPATEPAPEVAPAMPETPAPAVEPGLLIKNFAGETLNFTIDNQVYEIPDHGERLITLAPGEYTYTASIPFVARSSSVELQPGEQVSLSIAINVNHDFLNVYRN